VADTNSTFMAIAHAAILEDFRRPITRITLNAIPGRNNKTKAHLRRSKRPTPAVIAYANNQNRKL
jgi:hypothetical protein